MFSWIEKQNNKQVECIKDQPFYNFIINPSRI